MGAFNLFASIPYHRRPSRSPIKSETVFNTHSLDVLYEYRKTVVAGEMVDDASCQLDDAIDSIRRHVQAKYDIYLNGDSYNVVNSDQSQIHAGIQ